MADPLAEIVALLRPEAPFAKRVSGAGRWRVRRAEAGRPFYCVVLDGSVRLAVEGRAPVLLERGDFVLIPSAGAFTASSREPPVGAQDGPHAVSPTGEVRVGDPHGPADAHFLVGHCAFASPDARLLLSFLPQLVLARGQPRLSTLVELVREEFRARRPAREVVLGRLLEVLLIEALRCEASGGVAPGILRGLADERLAPALRRMHEEPARPWTVARLAREAALSRSAFFDRFRRVLGVAPMEYLLEWRMALAKDLLRSGDLTVAEVAARVGYGSGSTFSAAFARRVGVPPTRYGRRGAGTPVRAGPWAVSQ